MRVIREENRSALALLSAWLRGDDLANRGLADMLAEAGDEDAAEVVRHDRWIVPSFRIGDRVWYGGLHPNLDSATAWVKGKYLDLLTRYAERESDPWRLCLEIAQERFRANDTAGAFTGNGFPLPDYAKASPASLVQRLLLGREGRSDHESLQAAIERVTDELKNS